jgi:hypothetical protein
MTNIVLISKIAIVNQIFTLIAKKLSLNLTILENTEIDENVDILILDNEFLDDNIIKCKTFSNMIIGLTDKNEIINNEVINHCIEKPFLPSELEVCIVSYIKELSLQSINNVSKDTSQHKEEPVDNLEDLISFVDDIAIEEEVSTYNEYDEDIVIKKEDLAQGGVLDSNELGKLFDIINDDPKESTNAMHDDDWVDLSDIIDTAIEDVQEYKFEEKKKQVELILNNHTMEELYPLFKKLDQNIIDNLIEGKEVSVQVRLKND